MHIHDSAVVSIFFSLSQEQSQYVFPNMLNYSQDGILTIINECMDCISMATVAVSLKKVSMLSYW